MSHFEFEIRSSVSLRRFCQKSRAAANTVRQSAQIQFRAKKSKDRATSAASVASDCFQTACEYSGVASLDILTCQRGRDRGSRFGARSDTANSRSKQSYGWASGSTEFEAGESSIGTSEVLSASYAAQVALSCSASCQRSSIFSILCRVSFFSASKSDTDLERALLNRSLQIGFRLLSSRRTPQYDRVSHG